MQTLQQALNKNEVSQQNKELAAKFEELKATPIERADEWTVVNLRHIVGCGCGGGGTDIHIAIPGNHPEFEDNIFDNYGSSVDDSDIRHIQRRFPDAIVMRGTAPSGITDMYSPDNYLPI